MLDTHIHSEIYGFISLRNLHLSRIGPILDLEGLYNVYISDPLEMNGVVMMMPARFSEMALTYPLFASLWRPDKMDYALSLM